LHGVKRNEVLELWEVERYGVDGYGDRDYVTIYDRTPRQWYAKGVRLFGRTAVECTRQCRASGWCSAGALAHRFVRWFGQHAVLLTRHLPEAGAVGFELDDAVFSVDRSWPRWICPSG
jgi:hypothetical protein